MARKGIDDNTRVIPLTQGAIAIVDAEDFPELIKYKWCVTRRGQTCYAIRRNNGTSLGMHRLIMNAPKDLVVDHIDHNGLNNTRANLRLCTPTQNQYNRRSKPRGSSKYKGVSYCKSGKPFRAQIRYRGKTYHLGKFKDEKQAALSYDKKAKQLFGEFAYLNFPEEK